MLPLDETGSSRMIQRKTSFGSDDQPQCPKCGGRMSVSRRSPDPERGEAYEIQTISCSGCEHEFTRNVDRSGKTQQRV